MHTTPVEFKPWHCRRINERVLFDAIAIAVALANSLNETMFIKCYSHSYSVISTTAIIASSPFSDQRRGMV